MQVVTATSPGHGRPTEDFVAAGPGFAVLLDGIGIPGTEHLCRHGVAWYARTLGTAILAAVLREPGWELRDALAAAIESVAARHRDGCDIADPSSPQAAVAAFRCRDGGLDYLVLADAYAVLEPAAGPPRVITDPRDIAVNNECAALLDGLAPGTPEYDAAYRAAARALLARRNRPGGYWIAKDDPAVAAEAVTGIVLLADLRGVALLSNGAARIVDPYALATWPEALSALRDDGPAALIDRIRAAERADRERWAPDDATIAYADLSTDR